MPIQTQTFAGFPDGMNAHVPPHELKDSEAAYLQDVLVHEFGLTIRRGPVQAVSGVAALAKPACGLVLASDPAGVFRIGAINGDGGGGFLSVYSTDLTTKTDLSIGPFPTSPTPIVDSHPMLNGGALIGIADQYDLSAGTQYLVLWRGAAKANYTTGTLTASQGSSAITGSGTLWAANLAPGMFLISGGKLLGVIQSVNSDTAVTLEAPSPWAVTGATYTAQSIRGWVPVVDVGTITTNVANTSIIGSNTKFTSQGVASGWTLVRASDRALVGTVASVQSNTALTLSANSAIGMTSEEYELRPASSDFSFSIQGTKVTPGFINTVYAGLQFYANRAKAPDITGDYPTRLWYSDSSDPESVDMSLQDGNFFNITSARGVDTPVRAMVPCLNTLLVLKEREAHIIEGTTPTTFDVKKIAEDGALSGMSALPYQGGAIWAGRDGIWFYDGTSDPENLIEDNLALFYQQLVKNFDVKTYRMWAMVHRDHYMLHIEHVSSPVNIQKGVTSVTPTRMTIIIYIPARAVSLFSNVDFRGSAIMSSTSGLNAWYIVNDATKGNLCSIDDLFDSQGIDSITCVGNTAGPDLYIESKKYSAGDGLRKKLWKQLMLHYIIGGDSLKLDVVPGMNTIGVTSTATWSVTSLTWQQLALLFPTWNLISVQYPTWSSLTGSLYQVKRLKFLKRSQYLAFRLYQNSASVTNVRLGSFALGFKLQRPGRV